MSAPAAPPGDHDSIVKANRLGVLSMIGAMACFIVNDGLVKYASETLPAAQLIFVRGAMASMLMLAVAQAMGEREQIREIARGWVATRSIVDAIAAFLYLFSLFHLPIANATAINMTSPLLITALAAIFIGEQVGLSRWLAIGAGFIGVLLIIQPQTGGFNLFALVCLLATLLLAVRDLLTRRVHVGVSSTLLTLSTTVAMTLLAGALSLFETWQPMGAFELGLLAIAAVFLATGYYLVIGCTRYGELSLTAPFRYTGLLFATLAGYVVWGDRPNVLAWCGTALMIGSGIHILRANGRARAARVILD
jgi:drug/metabolite transporter (DMT)-like permease